MVNVELRSEIHRLGSNDARLVSSVELYADVRAVFVSVLFG